MQTQITCPNCGIPYMTNVHQIIDVGQHPELKQMLLSGQLNVAVCPNCGAAGQVATAMLYHDPAHELFMVYVPQEMNLDHDQREQIIGQLVLHVMDNTPQEQRRAYMFQPQTVLSMQSFMENVLETEGITKEMMARQRKQIELLNTLAKADSDVVDYLLQERADEIDETFFAMLKSYIDQAAQMNDNSQLIPLVNLQAKLMTETAVGREIEKRQIALHALNKEAKEAGGLTPQLLLRHVLLNQEDLATLDAIIQVGAGAMTYDFFTGLTAEIDKQRLAGNEKAARRLTELRADLLKIQEEMQKQSEMMVQNARQTLEAILAVEDMEAAVQANMEQIDEAFMYVLTTEISRAAQEGQDERLRALEQVHELIVKQIEGYAPPEIQLLNDLVQAETEGQRQGILDENEDLLSEDLLKIVDLLQDQAQTSGQEQLDGRLSNIKALIRERL